MHAPTPRHLALLAVLAALQLGGTASLQAATAPAGQAQREVLPVGVAPEHYELEVTPDAVHLAFAGTVRITVQVAAPTDRVTLNAADLEVDSASWDGQPVAGVEPEPARERLGLRLAGPAPAGRHELLIHYRGRIHEHAEGLFALDFEVGGSQRRALFTQFEAADARRFVPCWDEPAYKATWNLVATVPAADVAVSNMPAAETTGAGAGLVRVRFATTPKMSSYLLFFASGDFERVHRVVDGVDLGVVVPRGLTGQAGYALDAAAQLLPWFNEYFGVRYPLPKLDLVAGPGSSTSFGAMENWGAIFSFQSVLLIDPALSTEANRRNVYTTTAHEMAHQWFGDLVTMDWWDGIWLNEGFATWMQRKSTDHFHPQWQEWVNGQGGTQAAMRIDAAIGTHPVITPITNVSLSDGAFDAITYQKGSAVIRMLENQAGEATFRDGVRRYLRAHAYGNSVTDELWDAIAAAGAKDFVPIAHAFTLQAGVPLLTVESTGCRSGEQRLRLSQSRFALDESGREGAQRWPVPVQLRSLASGTTQALVVEGAAPRAARLEGCAAVVANAGQAGYYRVRYQGAARAALVAAFAQLPVAEQVGLYDDTVALAFAGDLPLAAPLELAAKLPVSADPQVWAAVLGTLRRLDQLADDHPGQAALRAHARALLAPLLAQYGWEARSGEPGNLALVRADLLGTLGRFDDAGVLAEARARFARWLQAPASLDAAQRDTVLGIVAAQADLATWQQLRALATASHDPLESQHLWSLLAPAGDAAVARSALEFALQGEMPRTLRARLIGWVGLRHPDIAALFVIAHWDAVRELVDEGSRPVFTAQVAAASADPSTIAALEAFADAKVAAGSRRMVTRTVAAMRQNQKLRARLPELTAWSAGATA
jgi:aminopeptidase N